MIQQKPKTKSQILVNYPLISRVTIIIPLCYYGYTSKGPDSHVGQWMDLYKRNHCHPQNVDFFCAWIMDNTILGVRKIMFFINQLLFT